MRSTRPPISSGWDLAAFERVLEHVSFDELGRILDIPPYEELRRLAGGSSPVPQAAPASATTAG